MVDYSKRLIRGTGIVLVFLVVSALLGYVLKLVMAKTLVVRDIGLFFSVLGLVSFFTFFRDLGLSDALIYYLPRFLVEDSKKKIKSSIMYTLFVQLSIGVLVFIVMLLLSNFLAVSYFKDPRAKMLLIFLSLYFIVDGAHEVLLRIYNGYQKVFFQQALDFSFQVFSFAFFLYVIFAHVDISYLGLAYFAADLITVIIFYFVFIKKVFPNYHELKVSFDARLFRELLNYSLPIMAWTIAEVGFAQQTIFFLTLFVGLDSVAYYVMPKAIAKLSNFIYKASFRVFSPMISELWKRKKLPELSFLFKEQMVLIYLFAFPFAIGLFLFSDVALRLLYGEKFVVASIVLKLSAICILFEIFNSILNTVSQNTGSPKLSRNNAYLKFFINVVFNILLIPKIGLAGAVWADLIAILAASAHILYFNAKKTKISLPIKEFSYMFVSSAIYILAIIGMKTLVKLVTLNIYLEVGIVMTISGAVYLLCAFYFRLIDIEKINLMAFKMTNGTIDMSFLVRQLKKKE